jgi:hypothetical protein
VAEAQDVGRAIHDFADRNRSKKENFVKKTTSSLLVALLATAGMAIAQTGTSGTGTTSTADPTTSTPTTETPTTSAPTASEDATTQDTMTDESRPETQPTTESQSPTTDTTSTTTTASAGATFTEGTVQSFTTDSVIVRDDTGRLVTVSLRDDTLGRASLVNGSRVRVDFRADVPAGQVVAREIVISPSTSTMAAAPATTPPATTYTAPSPTTAPSDTTADMDMDMDTDTDTLPQTASRLHVFALLGLLALASGVAMRVFR